MKCNFLISSYFIYICTSVSFAQSFAPLGAVWGYQEVESDTSDVKAFFQVGEDTIIQNRVCSIIQEVNPSNGDIISEEIVYSEGDSVMVLIEDTFYKIFDFGANPGDTIRVIETPFPGFFSPKPSDPQFYYQQFVYRIDSVDEFVLEGDTLVLQYITGDRDPEESEWGFQDCRNYLVSGQILEGVGSLWRFSPLGIPLSTCYINTSPSPLACYIDSFKSVQFLAAPCDLSPIMVSSEVEIQEAIYAYPNPTNDIVYLSGISLKHATIKIYDWTGKEVNSFYAPQSPLSLEGLPAGAYFMKIYSQSNVNPRTFKIIKQ